MEKMVCIIAKIRRCSWFLKKRRKPRVGSRPRVRSCSCSELVLGLGRYGFVLISHFAPRVLYGMRTNRPRLTFLVPPLSKGYRQPVHCADRAPSPEPRMTWLVVFLAANLDVSTKEDGEVTVYT